MSHISIAIERLAAESGCDVLELQEYYLQRLGQRFCESGRPYIGQRKDCELGAVDDCRKWLESRHDTLGSRGAR